MKKHREQNSGLNRRDLLKSGASGLVFTAFLLIVATALGASASEKPNILFITSDDLGLQLGCYGDTVIETHSLLADSVSRRTMIDGDIGYATSRDERYAGTPVRKRQPTRVRIVRPGERSLGMTYGNFNLTNLWLI